MRIYIYKKISARRYIARATSGVQNGSERTRLCAPNVCGDPDHFVVFSDRAALSEVCAL